MPIQNSGKISVTDIVEEFSSRLPVDIANFNNITLTDLVNVMGDMIGKSPSDEISFADFYGLSNYRILLANNPFEVITTYSTVLLIKPKETKGFQINREKEINNFLASEPRSNIRSKLSNANGITEKPDIEDY